MTNLRFNYCWAITALAIAAIALSLSLYPATGARSLAAADLTAEKQALTSFADGLTSLEKNVAELQKRSSITSTELNSAKTSASTLKTKVSPLGQTFQSVINKLKAAGEWENFDATVLKQTTDPKAQALISNAGGAKKILQDAATQLSGLSTEIDALVQPLNSRVASTGFSFGNSRALGFMPVRASFTPTATAAFASGKCIFYGGLYIVVGTKRSENRWCCNCCRAEYVAEACAAL